jgi:hypothetical protein
MNSSIMKKYILFFLTACLFSNFGLAQKKKSYTEDDAKQFYRTIEGTYKEVVNDSTAVTLHIIPIWENEDDRFSWLYLEAVNDSTGAVLEQKILEVNPLSGTKFMLIVHGLKNPKNFVGKWGNRNFFDGCNKSILKGKAKYVFTKTKDFEYQTKWHNRKAFKSFMKGDRLHFKFVQEDEALYIKRVPSRSSHIIGLDFMGVPTDMD